MKAGDLVKASYVVDNHSGLVFLGVVVDIENITDIFSEKYAITETNTYIKVLSDCIVRTFTLHEDKIELINEDR